MKLTTKIQQTSVTGYSILTLRKESDTKHCPAVQSQMPTDVAEYIVKLIEKDQKYEGGIYGYVGRAKDSHKV